MEGKETMRNGLEEKQDGVFDWRISLGLISLTCAYEPKGAASTFCILYSILITLSSLKGYLKLPY